MHMDRMEKINDCWSALAESFGDMRNRADLREDLLQAWAKEIRKYLPARKRIRALDLGTGVGYLAFLLEDLGCEVTGIDYSRAMIDLSVQKARELGHEGVRFLQMDARELRFENGSFDFVFTRNVTWTLPEADQAYAEMCRVLSPGGVLLNGDSNQGARYRGDDGLPELSGIPADTAELFRTCDLLASRLDISQCLRPQWDVDVLLRLGMSRITVDMDAVRRLYPGLEKEALPYRFFLLSAVKGAAG